MSSSSLVPLEPGIHHRVANKLANTKRAGCTGCGYVHDTLATRYSDM